MMRVKVHMKSGRTTGMDMSAEAYDKLRAEMQSGERD